MKNSILAAIAVFLLVSLISCVTIELEDDVQCKQLKKGVKVCKDYRHEDRCRIRVEREDPYPSTESNLLLCEGLF